MNDYMVGGGLAGPACGCAGQAPVVARRRHHSRRLSRRGFVGLKASLDAQGKLVAWRHHRVTYGDGKQLAPGANIGADEFPSGFAPHYALYTSAMPLMLRPGYLRAPGNNAYTFVGQSLLDEPAGGRVATRWSFNWRS
jgi:hypothetical protein